MADIMPVFPLGLVVFPGELVNLHIFEPRYKQLLEEVRANNIHFALAPYFEAKELLYGTEVELVKTVKVYADGKSDITLRGLNIVKIIDFFPKHPQKLYPCAEIESIEFYDNPDVLLSLEIIKKLNRLYVAMNIQNIKLKDEIAFRCSDVAHKVGFSLEQELDFMLIDNEYDRAQFLNEHLDFFIPQVIAMEELRKRAQLNGHFQNLKSPF